jgi:hypothetical protein
MPGKNLQFITIALLVLPFFAAAFAFRRTVHKGHLFFHLFLALLVGASTVFIGPQFLSESVVQTIRGSEPYHALQPYTSLIIASAFLISTVFLWLSHPKEHKPKKHHGHH